MVNEPGTPNEETVSIEAIPSEVDDSESTPTEFEIATYPADYTLEVLYEKLRAKEIVIPTFQRGLVWKKPQGSRLIESFLMGLPVPQIFVYIDPDQKALVIDGQQRLRSILYYFEGFWGEADASGKRKVFKLDEINEKSRWHGKSFKELEDADQRRLKNAVLRAIIVKQLKPEDPTSIFHIFERLNTGGTLLRPQEVRNCVYGGKFNDLLIKLNLHPAWRQILGKTKPDDRQRDVELVLRFLALYHEGNKYEKHMKDFLSKFMKKHRNPPLTFLDEEGNRFIKTCDFVLSQFGKTPFNPRGSLNTAFFDSTFVAVAKHLDKPAPKNLGERFHSLINNSSLDVYTRGATTDTEIVRKRLEIAEKALFG